MPISFLTSEARAREMSSTRKSPIVISSDSESDGGPGGTMPSKRVITILGSTEKEKDDTSMVTSDEEKFEDIGHRGITIFVYGYFRLPCSWGQRLFLRVSSDEDFNLQAKNVKRITNSPFKSSVKTIVESPKDFYHDNLSLPVFSRQSSRLDTQEMVSILLDPDLKEEHICKTQPVNVEHNSIFIVDLSQLGSTKDIYVDDMGSWKYNGVYRTWVSVECDGFMSTHGKLKPTKSEDESLYYIKKNISYTKQVPI